MITLDRVSVAFGHLPLLDQISLSIEPGERIAVLGRNGEGKSTLLRVLAGDLAPDSGIVRRAPGTRAARLAQDASEVSRGTVFDVVSAGVSRAHEEEEWRREQKTRAILNRLSLEADAEVSTLSGGWRRRVALAQALVSGPTLLLLDEPTNHLDLGAIVWLETFLADYDGAVVIVTHDRAFLQRVANRIVELDRGRLTSWPGDYKTFLTKKDAWLANEARANENFDKKMAQEEAWLRRGVKARRTRDEGRVKRLLAMREERAARRSQSGVVRLDLGGADRSGHVVFEAEGISKSFGGRVVVSDFSTRVMRGDRVGLVGPNGIGKTTLLRMLMGEIAPDSGTIERGTNLSVAYFDQQRAQLDPERTIVQTVADGNDTVTIGGRSRHVFGYLEDFLFSSERAQAKVKMLSGGERNRLLLARLLTQPANVLILDEPTNDLDLETLTVLEAELTDFPGTILVVSHDRVFLENVVTSTWMFEGGGRIVEYVGTDFDRWTKPEPAPPVKSTTRAEAARPAGSPAARKRLSYKEQRELDALPGRIEALEEEERQLQARIASPDFYKENAADIRAALDRAGNITREVEALYERWAELEPRA